MTTCKNCSTEFKGKFCPECGQKAKVKRITIKTVLDEVRRSMFHYDQGFVFTVWQLLIRPGLAIREYLEGKRVMHIKPVKFMLWATALNFLVFHLLGLDEQMLSALAERQGTNPAGTKFSHYILDHPAVMLLLLIPTIALFSWLYLRRSGYNYAEHFVANAYLMGEVSLFGLLMNPVMKMIGYDHSGIYIAGSVQTVIWMGYMGWGYTQLFRPRRKWIGWLKAVLAIISGYFLLLIVISVLIATAIILFGPWLKPLLKG